MNDGWGRHSDFTGLSFKQRLLVPVPTMRSKNTPLGLTTPLRILTPIRIISYLEM